MSKCGCGCGGEASPGRRFISGHWIRVNNPMNNPESRKKVGDSKRGKHLSEETCQKMSASHTGVKRTPHTKATKGKIGDAHRGKTKKNSESVRRQAEKMTGRTKENHDGVRRGAEKKRGRTKENDEGVRRRAEAQKGRPNPNKGKTYEEIFGIQKANEIMKKIKDNHADCSGENSSMYGKHHTEESREQMSKNNAMKNRPEIREKASKATIKFYQDNPEAKPIGTKNGMFGKHHTKEARKKISEANSNPSEERRKQISESTKLLWQDPVYVQKVLTAWNLKPNEPEQLIYNILQKFLPNEYTLNIKGEVLILAGKRPDFVNINGKKKVIEFNGCYFHECPLCFPDKGNKGLIETEKRVKLFKKYGWSTLVIWEHELKDMKAVVNKILEFHNIRSLSTTKQLTID